MTLRALLEKTSDADLLREMIGFTAERLMALEVEGLTGAAHGERTPERITHRNGYRERSWETRAGTVTIGSSGGWPASHSWREPSPAFAGAGSDAASCRRRACAVAGGGARRAGAPATPGLQALLGPAVAQRKVVPGAQMVVEVLHRPAPVAAAILLKHPFDPVRRNPARGGLAQPAVEQTVASVLLVTPPVAPERPLRHPQQLRRIQRRKTLRLETSQHIVELLHPAFL